MTWEGYIILMGALVALYGAWRQGYKDGKIDGIVEGFVDGWEAHEADESRRTNVAMEWIRRNGMDL